MSISKPDWSKNQREFSGISGSMREAEPAEGATPRCFCGGPICPECKACVNVIGHNLSCSKCPTNLLAHAHVAATPTPVEPEKCGFVNRPPTFEWEQPAAQPAKGDTPEMLLANELVEIGVQLGIITGNDAYTGPQLLQTGKDIKERIGRYEEKIDILDNQASDLFIALRGIIDIGKRDMTNPKYSSCFDHAKEVLDRLSRAALTETGGQNGAS